MKKTLILIGLLSLVACSEVEKPEKNNTSASIKTGVDIETDMVDKEYQPIIEACMREWASSRKNTGYVRPHYMDFQGDRYLIMYNGLINVRSPYGHMEQKIIENDNFICNLNSESQKIAQDIEKKIIDRKNKKK